MGMGEEEEEGGFLVPGYSRRGYSADPVTD